MAWRRSNRGPAQQARETWRFTQLFDEAQRLREEKAELLEEAQGLRQEKADLLEEKAQLFEEAQHLRLVKVDLAEENRRLRLLNQELAEKARAAAKELDEKGRAAAKELAEKAREQVALVQRNEGLQKGHYQWDAAWRAARQRGAELTVERESLQNELTNLKAQLAEMQGAEDERVSAQAGQEGRLRRSLR